MADIEHRTLTSGPDPVLAAHYATKNYVDTVRNDVALNTRTASYTLAASDEGRCVQMSSGSATTLTVPSNASVAFPVGTVVWVRRLGAGGVTVAGAVGVNVRTAASLTLGAQYSTVWLHKVASDEWVLST